MNKVDYESHVGSKINRLLITSVLREKGGETRFVCKCDCGKITTPKSRNVLRGISKSCGCFSKDAIKQRKTIHGLSSTRFYSIWIGMMHRCYLKGFPSYKYYGDRGIVVCNEWHDFESFYKWASSNQSYDENLEIDRIDNNGMYCPENCKWSSRIDQLNNRRSTLYVSFNGEIRPLSEVCKETGTRYGKALYRKKSGIPDELIFSKDPIQKRKTGTCITHGWRNAV
jgi:hypothetical protein